MDKVLNMHMLLKYFGYFENKIKGKVMAQIVFINKILGITQRSIFFPLHNRQSLFGKDYHDKFWDLKKIKKVYDHIFSEKRKVIVFQEQLANPTKRANVIESELDEKAIVGRISFEVRQPFQDHSQLERNDDLILNSAEKNIVITILKSDGHTYINYRKTSSV